MAESERVEFLDTQSLAVFSRHTYINFKDKNDPLKSTMEITFFEKVKLNS